MKTDKKGIVLTVQMREEAVRDPDQIDLDLVLEEIVEGIIDPENKGGNLLQLSIDIYSENEEGGPVCKKIFCGESFSPGVLVRQAAGTGAGWMYDLTGAGSHRRSDLSGTGSHRRSEMSGAGSHRRSDLSGTGSQRKPGRTGIDPRSRLDRKRTGLRLKQYLQDSCLTVRELKTILGLEYAQGIYRWFKGESMPSTDHFYLLHLIFNCHMEDLIVMEDEAHILTE